MQVVVTLMDMVRIHRRVLTLLKDLMEVAILLRVQVLILLDMAMKRILLMVTM